MQGMPQSQVTPGVGQEREPAWSIARLVELVDAAIDTAGAQLARSVGLSDDLPTPFDERDRPSGHRRTRLSSARDLLEQPDSDSGLSPT